MFSKTHDNARRPASRRIILLAVILLMGILVGALTLTLRQGIISFPGTTRIPVSNAPIKNGLLLSEVGVFTKVGVHFKMFTEQVGWTLGDSRQNPASRILRTIDGGHHWQDVTPAGFSGYFYVLDENTAWVSLGLPDSLGRTTDGGKTWQPMTMMENDHIEPQLTFISQNEGWEFVPPTYPLPPCKCPLTPTPDIPSVVYHTLDGGKTWQKVGSLLGPEVFDMHFLSSQVGWASESGGIDSTGPNDEEALYATVDGGKTWTKHTLPVPAGDDSEPTPDSIDMLDFTSASTGYLRASFRQGNYVYTTRDAGNSWQVLGNNLPDDNQNNVTTLLDNQHAIYTAPPALEVLTLTNNHWTRRVYALPEGDDSFVVDFDFFSLQRGFVAMYPTGGNGPDLFQRSDLYQTVDGGRTWTKLGSLPLAA